MQSLTIVHTEASDGWGGQEIRIVQESLGMMRRGHRIVLCAPAHSAIYARAQEAGIEAVHSPVHRKSGASAAALLNLLKTIRPDIINTHSSADSWVAGIAAQGLFSAKPKIIRTRHLSTPISRSFLSRIVYDVLPDAVMTTGEEIRNRMISVNRFRADKIISVPTGVDLASFDASLVPPPKSAGRGCAIGMLGVLRSWKGHQYFLQAVPLIKAGLPLSHFFIAGEGPQRENIEKAIRSLAVQDDVTMLGHREDVPELLSSFDVVVHPSYANEGVPQSILQALAMKRAVVASDAGAIREVIIDGRTGCLIEPKRPDLIAEKVIDLCRNEEKRSAYGEAGRKLVEREYSFDRMLDVIEGLYTRLLGSA
ncbi:MAG TPA: glycosyltransferase family 4 protein [Dissulfurispiraceae bacterium]|nr:glycosyltransferase family 4 protein [Dissulfurispiraceae bacterium]